ncbi:hypothetical protein EMIT0111MI5_90261 [Burkholderia sp. IT-111MI5]
MAYQGLRLGFAFSKFHKIRSSPTKYTFVIYGLSGGSIDHTGTPIHLNHISVRRYHIHV